MASSSAVTAAAAASALFSVVGKKVLVTGGSRGIGYMIAKGFVEHGADVFITSRDENACREACDKLNNLIGGGDNKNQKTYYTSSNLGTREGCNELANKIYETFDGKLDVLINNAGASWGEDYIERESGIRSNWGWDKVLDLNVKGIFYLSKKCIPMLQRTTPEEGVGPVHNPGRIINIGSVAGIIPQEAPTHAYDVSKAAVHHLSKKMSNDLSSYGITVNVVAPGFVPSKMSSGLQKYTDLTKPDVISKVIPLRRLGNEHDMAGACIYLSSQAGSWITGTILPVDGGTSGSLQIPLSSL